MATAKRARLMGLIMLAMMFAVGALTGAATIRVVDAEEAPGMKQKRQQQAQEQERQPDLLERLELTPEQRAQADAILERHRAAMEEFWNEHGPTVRAIRDSARVELRAILTPEQQAVEEQFRQERVKRSEQRERDRQGRGSNP